MKKYSSILILMFAVFSNQVLAALEIVITEGVDSARPIAVLPFVWEGNGVVPEQISKVVANDLILEIDGVRVADRAHLRSLVSEKAGNTVDITIIRGSELIEKSVNLSS